MAQLNISDVTLSFGGLKALSHVDMTIEPGLITSIIGPNGAGKTSMLNCISGFYHPTKGKILYKDKDLSHASPHQVSTMGIARAFQNLELFSGLSVLDNLLLARHQNLTYSLFHAAVFFGKASRVEAENRKFVEDIIDFMELEPYRKNLVGNLSYGIQKKVEVARALTMDPEILLLDEASSALDQSARQAAIDLLKSRKDLTLLSVTHDREWIEAADDLIELSGVQRTPKGAGA